MQAAGQLHLASLKEAIEFCKKARDEKAIYSGRNGTGNTDIGMGILSRILTKWGFRHRFHENNPYSAKNYI